MNKLIMLLLFSITTNAYALPDCPSDTSKLWDKCFGTINYDSGDKYVGEWKEGKKHGQGTYTFGNQSQWAGEKYVGEIKDGNYHGQGTYAFADGEQLTGYYLNDKYIPTTCKNMGLVKGSSEFGQCIITLINKL
ncbi:hypothetical protein N9F19_01220 [Gammaproteobacteria bacterium]|nr:hypothetical protein [Gammaproteobacteria bacterium]